MIVGNLATYPRRLESLKLALPRVLPQVDALNVCLNEFDAIPSFVAGLAGVNAVIPSQDLKDVGKFIFQASPDDYVFTFDDDILYPPDYTKKLIERLDFFGDFPIAIGVHGSIYSDYFDGRTTARVVYPFDEALPSPKAVNQIGTGTMAVRGRWMPTRSFMEGGAGFVDVRFARHAYERGIALAIADRPRRWLQAIESDADSLWEIFTQSSPDHVIAEIDTFAGYAKLPIQAVLEIEVKGARPQPVAGSTPRRTAAPRAGPLRHKRLIIKADDYARGPPLDGWRRFFDVCLNLGATPSVGIVAGDFARNQPAQHLARYLRDASQVEFWNHSLDHRDLTLQSSAERVRETIESQKIFGDTLGAPASVFGPPFNRVNSDALQDVQEAGQFSAIYFADAAGDDPHVAPNIPIALKAPLELSTTALHPIDPRRLFRHLQRAEEPPAMVLQLHPGYWSDECFRKFESVLRALLAKGYRVLTAQEYLSSVEVSASAPAPKLDAGSLIAAAELIHDDAQEDIRMLGGDRRDERTCYIDRLNHNLVGISRFLHENGLGERAAAKEVCRILNIGAGICNWTMAAAADRPNVEAVALDRDASLMDFLREETARYFADARCSFVAGAAEDLQFESDSFDYVICNNALNDMQLERATAEIGRVVGRGTALLGVQNELYPLLDTLGFLSEGDNAAALDHLDRIFTNLARRNGSGGPAPFICYWTDRELMTAAAYGGLHCMRKGITLPDEHGALFGMQTLWGYLLRINGPSKERAAALRQGKGATASDLDMLICMGADELALKLLGSVSPENRPSRLDVLIGRAATLESASIDQILSRLDRIGFPVGEAAAESARAVHGMCAIEDWAGLARYHQASQAPFGALCAAWFALRAGQTVDADAGMGAGPGETALFALGRAAAAGDRTGVCAGVAAFFDAYADQAQVMQLLTGDRQDSLIPRSRDGFAGEKAKWLAAMPLG